MAASLAIHRLSARTPARAQPVAARLALQVLGTDLEDALPRGLPPQALLWLRRLRLQAPEAALLRPAPVAWRQDWIAAGRERLDAALAQAARPALGPVSEGAEAVLFADTAEMLACLALAARTGQLDRWWWRGLLGRAWPHWQTAWAARPQAQAAAQRLLQRAGQGGVVAFDAASADERVELQVMTVTSTAAPPLPARAAGVAAATAAEALPRELPVVAVDEPAPVNQSAMAVADVAAWGLAEAERAAAIRVVPPASTESTCSQLEAPLGGAAPAWPLANLQPEPSTSAPVLTNPPRPAAPRRARIDTPLPTVAINPPTSATPRVDAIDAPHAEPRPTAAEALPSAAQPAIAALAQARRAPAHHAPPAASSPKVSARATDGEAPRAAVQSQPAAAPRVGSEPAAADSAWPWPRALLSRQAPLLFIVNALLEDGLYPDFTRPRDAGLPVPLWALVAALAHAWRLPDDPLHAALSERAGDWTAPALMPAAPGAAASPWALWLPNYARTLRRRLCRRLGQRAVQWPRALTLAHPARLWLSEAEWVAEFDLAGHQIAWRLAGLDRDPGWLPSAGCGLRFEFR